MMKPKHPYRAATLLLALILLSPSSQDRQSLTGSLASLMVSTASAADEPIDFDRAKQYQRKKQSGGTLTDEEEAYMRKAIQEYQKQKGASKGAKKGDSAPKSTTPVSDPEIVKKLVPIDELSAPYKGEDGGLYGGGHNTPPAAHLTAYLKESAKIQPLDSEGQPSKSGKIVVLSIGMSNTTMEYSKFKSVADQDPKKAPNVVIVDGAQGGKTGITWAADGRALLPADEQARVAKVLEGMGRKPEMVKGIWSLVDERLKAAGVTAQQIQVVWIKHAEARPKGLGEFPEHARVLESNIIDTLMIAKQKYPNLRVAYLASRIFGGYATSDLNPEPYAYEEGFSMRWVIQDQIKGDSRLNYDSSKGEVKSPIVLWGPYLWANGTTPRKTDGFFWEPGDFVSSDHTHPDTSARQKVADLLLKFLETDKGASRWFVAGSK